MKKLLLAIVALGCAFAISSCCDQKYCPKNMKCNDKIYRKSEDTPYRWDNQEERQAGQERQHRRW